ncbi:hypothetical protein [Saliniramus fredricksonii]|uniref:Transposase n=1 Tax=Saliniramus fredricksonii TaxID=1653334 RepID=A0ABY0K9R4_9HYPH|nr:hypothetical protein [Saliniramus fredricksonii]SCC81171.1 hypothetical protein GA0071312_2104 [Saliniramus fredricksonii]
MTHDAESMPQRARPWRFDDFAEDAILGEATLILDEARLTRWAGLFGQTAPPTTAPAGLLVALLMEGYMDAISPRPLAISMRASGCALPAPGSVQARP